MYFLKREEDVPTVQASVGAQSLIKQSPEGNRRDIATTKTY